jgi:hypothetical protein
MRSLRTIAAVSKTLIRLCGLLIVFNCVTPTELETNYVARQIVISGQISTIPERNTVTVGITARSERLPEPLTDAMVVLYDDKGNEFYYEEDSVKAGTYVLPNYSGEPNTGYRLSVMTPDGEVYQSAWEILPSSSGTMKTAFNFSREEIVDREGTILKENFVNVLVNSTFPNTEVPRFVKWSVDEVYLIRPTNFPDPFGYVPPDCFISQNADPQRIVTIDRHSVHAISLEGFLIGSRIADQSFHYKYYFTVYQSAISQEAYNYWNHVSVVANQTGSIFDLPPAAISGNIVNIRRNEEKVFGYFQAVNEQSERFSLISTDLPFVLPPYCDFSYSRPFDSYPAECLDCQRLRNSSIVRPAWF